MRLIAIAALCCGCWTSSVAEMPQIASPANAAIKPLPGCWTPEFHEAWPERLWYSDALGACQDDDTVDDPYHCVGTSYLMAYDRLWYWIDRWFEACSNQRR